MCHLVFGGRQLINPSVDESMEEKGDGTMKKAKYTRPRIVGSATVHPC